MKKVNVTLLLLIGIIASVFGQTYPVSLSARVAKPYAIYLSDYAQGSTERMGATLLLRDANEPFYDVRLRVLIKGAGIQIESKPDFATTPISLQTGIPLTLQNEDFAAYLNPSHLNFQGITRQQFERTGALPEGLYEISWQVYDFRRTEVSLSNQAITTAWIVLNNPPVINTPLATEKLTPREPQNVRFSWQQGGALLNGGFTTEYRLELYEMREEGRDPNEIIRGTPPVATLTQAGTSLTFDASQITLIPGMQYAFRVQARDTEGRSLYKNSGYSEVRTFIYGDACLPPTEVTTTEKSTQWVALAWQPSPTATQYVVRYRQAEDPNAQWFEDKTYTTTQRISGLRPGNTYEYQVKCQCGSFNSEYTTASTFATVGADEANLEVACSPTTLPAPVLDASTALPLAQPGSFFKVGHFDMKVTEVSGGAGTFSGKGEIFVPFLATTLKVSFQNLAVNLEGQVVSGNVTADVVDDRNLSVSTINRINGYQTAFSEICIEYDDEGYDNDGFDKEGFDRQGYDREGYNEEGRDREGYDRAGFNEEGFDRNGFDREGYDKEGFNKDGINREGRDRKGNLVGPDRAAGGAGPGGSNGLSESVADNALERVVKRYLNDKRDSVRDSVREQRGTVVSLSQALEDAIADAIEKKIIETRSSVVGHNEEHIGEGMSERAQITKDPKPDYPYYNVPKAHKDLYDADVLLQISLAKQTIIEQYRDDIASVATSVRERMDALDEEEATRLKEDEEAREAWIQQQVDTLVEEEVAKPEGESSLRTVIPGEASPQTVIPERSVAIAERRPGISRYGDESEHVAPNSYDFVAGDSGYFSSLYSEKFRNDGVGVGLDLVEENPEGYATLGAAFRPLVDPNVNMAFRLNRIIQDENRKRGQYAMDEARDLPVGISKVIGNTEFVVAIGGITFTPVAAYMDVYMGTEMPRSGNWLSFQAQAVEMFPEGFGGETNRLLLADDVPVRLSNAARLTLKGTEQRTFVEWDCQGFRQFGVLGEVEFCPGMIYPAPSGYTAANGTAATNTNTNGEETVKASFETVFTDWDAFIAQISLAPFQVKGLDGFVFEVNQAYLDFSDVQNPTGLVFPPDYQSPYVAAGVAELWQGFYLKQAKVTLPQKLEATAGKERPKALYVDHMIIDDQGVSGAFSAEGIIPDGSLGGWGYSVDRLSVQLVKNQLKGAEMLGGMQLSIMEDTLGYHARVQPGGHWLFAMSLRDELKIPMWAANVNLQAGSTVVVEEQEDTFAAHTILHGTVDINSKLLQNSVVRLSGIGFEGLVVSTEAPHFEPGIWSLGEAGVGNAAAGFELTLTNVTVEKQAENEVVLSMGARVDLANAIAGTTGLRLTARQETDFDTGRRQWKHVGTELDKIALSMEGGAVDLAGELSLFDNHQVYGEGFKGTVKATFGGKITVGAKALFGKVDGLRYWYADAMVKAGEIPLAGIPISLYGFGGGAYQHMRRERVDAVTLASDNNQTSTDAFATPSGIRYVPDASVGLGVKAAVAFGTSGDPRPFNGDVGFEMAFRKGGGVSTFGFEGNGYFMSDLDVGAPRSETPLYAGVDIFYDFQSRTLHGTCQVYASVAGGLIRGRNAGNLAGEAVLHFDPDNWYIHIGRPSSRVGLVVTTPIKAAPIKVDFGAYFMVGTQIEAMPLPPKEVTGNVSYEAERQEGAMLQGKGFAFGADFSINTGKLQAAIFYGELKAGAGFDVMLMNRDNMICAGRGKPGINGWYAEGQAYAYLEGAIGIRVKVFKVDIEEEILRIGAGALLEAKLPNPFWMRGNVNGHYSLLGGKVSGRCDFGFEVGEQCQWQSVSNPEESSVVEGLSVISALTPESGKQEVDVFAAPQAVFNLPIDEPFTLVDTLNDEQAQFKIVLDKFEVLNGSQVIEGTYEWNERYDVVAFDAHEILPGETVLTVVARVEFQEKRAGQWNPVRINGQAATEEMRHTFTTAKAPTYIAEENVVYSYPVNRQMHFLPQEYDGGGYVQLKDGQQYLFDADPKWRQTGRLTPVSGGDSQEFGFSYRNKRLTMALPSDLLPEQIYKLEIVKLPAAEGGQVDENVSEATRSQTQGGQALTIKTNQAEGEIERLQEEVLYTSYFRTSQYQTFAQKVASFGFVNDWQWAVKGLTGVQEIGRTVAGEELFDEFEMKGKAEMQPLVQFYAGKNTAWYKAIDPLVYANAAPRTAGLTIGWNHRPTHLGLPPIEAVVLDQVEEALHLSDAMISSGVVTGNGGKVAYVYQLPFYMYYDYYYLQQQAANSGLDSQGVRYLLDTPFIPIYSGQYPVLIGYRLPGFSEPNSSQQISITKP